MRDHGIGMRARLLERAFDLFVQDARTLDRAQGGIGIGLTMVRSLVKLHGGSVQALSDGPGRGCEIVVRLPLATEAGRPRPVAPRARRPPRTTPLHILVVDDNVDAASMLARLLRSLGHEVTVAHDGPGALATATAPAPSWCSSTSACPAWTDTRSRPRCAAPASRAPRWSPSPATDETTTCSARARRGFDHHLVKPVDLAALQRITAAQGEA